MSVTETLSDGSWPSPRNGHLTDGGPSPRNVHVTDAGPSPRNGHLTDGGGDPPSGSRSLAHSSGDERSERASQTSVHLSRPATISITQRPRGNVFRKDTRLTSPFVVQINLPPGTRPVGEVHARMVTDGGRGSVLLASVTPQFSSAFGGESFSSASVQLYATFELVRLHTGSHNNPAHICFDMAYIDSIGATHTVTSEPSAPFIVCTHSTQLVSAAGHLLRSTAFKSDSCLPWPAFSTLLRVHFTEAALLDRPPADADLEYIHERLNRAPLITVPEFNRLWDNWLGLVLKALTQRPGRAMWDSGLIAGLVPPERAARTLTAGTAVFGFHSATAELVAVFNPLTGGGPIRTCTNTDKRCVVDAVISDAAADTVWIAQRKTTVPKRKAERLAGLSPRRAAAKERRKGKRRSRNDTDSDSD